MFQEKIILAKNIEYYRNHLGMTQQDLADRAQIHFATLNAVINDPNRNVTLGNVSQIAKALGVPLPDLFQAHGDTENRYATRSQRFWENFKSSFETLFGYQLAKDEKFLREKFEQFFRYCGEDASLIEEYWRDRKTYGFGD
jgi:transcriptional regulator with XRE-family HTH domain